VEILTDLYLDTDDANYIFNQGRCFEQNRRYEDAVARFREYLLKADKARPGARADAQKHIADCQAFLGKTDADDTKIAPAAPAAEPASKPEVIAPSPVRPPERVADIQTSPQPATRRQGAGLRTAGLVLASVGGAGLLTGVVMNLKVNSMASDLRRTSRVAGNPHARAM
jgi:hypothetical protein